MQDVGKNSEKLGNRPAKFYEFGPFRLDPQNRVLLRDGQPVPLTGKPFDILLALAEHPGELLSKDELIARVWPDTIVEEGNLGRSISSLRKALEDSPEEHRYVLTLARRGYRFVAEVREIASDGETSGVLIPAEEAALAPSPAPDAEPPARTPRPRWVWIVALATLACLAALTLAGWRTLRSWNAPPIHSLAVLPLANLSGDSGQDYLADGITEDLITNLAEIEPLQVTSRTSVMQYKGTRKPIKQIARELNVEAVLEGAAMRSGNRVHITAQLIRADSDTHVWARSYDGDLGDVLGFESQVAQAIAREVAGKLNPATQAHARPANAAAYELYLRGRYCWNQRDGKALVKAADYFRQVIAKDPAYAPAYAGLADTCDLLAMDERQPTDLLAQARAAASKAIELDDRLPEAHTSLAGEKILGEWDWAGADREFQRALSIDPRYAPAHHWYGTLYLAPLGRIDQAMVEVKKAIDLEPLSFIYNTDLGWLYFLSGRLDLAIETLQSVLQLDPNFIPARFRLSEVYQTRGMFREAMQLTEEIFALLNIREPEDVQRACAAGDYPAFVRGMLKDMRKRSPVGRATDNYEAAIANLQLGEKRQALDALQLGAALHEPPMIFLKVEPVFGPLRGNANFQALERRIGLQP